MRCKCTQMGKGADFLQQQGHGPIASGRWRGSSCLLEGTTRAEGHPLHPCLPQSLRRPAVPQVSISTGQEAEPAVCLGPTSQQDVRAGPGSGLRGLECPAKEGAR